uniref:Uncharacterized protein n=1 Tax=Panagrolaimus davidi TaxID=227884 RepID=A0A914Q4K8_9BILA
MLITNEAGKIRHMVYISGVEAIVHPPLNDPPTRNDVSQNPISAKSEVNQPQPNFVHVCSEAYQDDV